MTVTSEGYMPRLAGLIKILAQIDARVNADKPAPKMPAPQLQLAGERRQS